MRADLYHLPWAFEPAEAEFEQLTLPAAHVITLQAKGPLLHFLQKIEVFTWSLARGSVTRYKPHLLGRE